MVASVPIPWVSISEIKSDSESKGLGFVLRATQETELIAKDCYENIEKGWANVSQASYG